MTEPAAPTEPLKPKPVTLCEGCYTEAACEALGRCRLSVIGAKAHPGSPAALTPSKPTPRPRGYSDAIADALCLKLMEGYGLNEICRDTSFPAESTIRLWVVDNHNEFAAKYARARDIGIDHRADMLKDTTREAMGLSAAGVAAMRLIVDTEKWYLSKIAPKRYGEKLEVDHKGGVNVNVVRFSDIAS